MDTAFLQDDPDSSSKHEMSLLRFGLEDLGWQIYSFGRNLMLAGKIPLPRDALVAGEVEVVLAAMQQLGIEIPPLQDYPASLSSLLHRKVWHWLR